MPVTQCHVGLPFEALTLPALDHSIHTYERSEPYQLTWPNRTARGRPPQASWAAAVAGIYVTNVQYMKPDNVTPSF